jgi:hypothetical protein
VTVHTGVLDPERESVLVETPRTGHRIWYGARPPENVVRAGDDWEPGATQFFFSPAADLVSRHKVLPSTSVWRKILARLRP